MTAEKTKIELMKKNINNLHKGTLMFWGDWFGRPMDNCHIIYDLDFNQKEKILTLRFDQGEILTIWNPLGINSEQNVFYIRNAQKIKWEWFSYGNQQTESNKYYLEYERQEGLINVSKGRVSAEFIEKSTIKLVGQHAMEIY